MSSIPPFAGGRWRRVAAAGVIAAAGLVLRGADTAAPRSLDEVKGDLRNIKRGDSPELNALGASAREALPKFTPAPDASAPPPAATRDSAAKKRPSSNWLLDAMAATAAPKAGQRPKEATTPAGEEERPLLDASDPAYLLKLYLAQEPERSASAEDPRKTEARRGRLEDVGSFESFLSRWMSPRDVDLLGFGKAGMPGTDGAGSPASLGLFGPTAKPAPPELRPNPYLEALKAGVSPPPAVVLDLPPPAYPAPPPGAVPPPTVPSVNPPPAIAPPPSADDQKYFPQLKRF